MTSRSETPESPAYAAWRAECAKIDLRREGAATAWNDESRAPLDVVTRWAEKLFPYPPEPKEPREVAIGGWIYRRMGAEAWECLRVGVTTCWVPASYDDAVIYRLASLLPKADRIRLAEEGE